MAWLPGFPESEPVLEAGLTHGGRVDDGHHQFHVLHDRPVEQALVTLL